MLIPAIIDSHGNPGILGVGIVVDVGKVDVVELLMKLDTVTVDTVKDVEVVDTVKDVVLVAVDMPPKDANRSIVDSS
jgi:hypothetical protein